MTPSPRPSFSPWLGVNKRLRCLFFAFIILGIGGAVYLSQFSLPLNFLKPTLVTYGEKIGVSLKSIDLSLVWRKWNRPVELRLKNLNTTLETASGSLTISIPRIYLTLHWGQLLRGKLEVSMVTLSQPTFSQGGENSSTLPSKETLQTFLKTFFRTPSFSILKTLSIENPFPKLWPNLLLTLKHQKESVSLRLEDKQGSLLEALLSYETTDDIVQITSNFKNVQIPSFFESEYASYLEKLPPLSGKIASQIGLSTPYQTGTFLLTGQIKSPHFFEELSLKGEWDGETFNLSEGKIKQNGVTALITGTWQKRAESPDGTNILIQASTDTLPLDKLSHLWPVALAPSARQWITENLKGGEVPSATLSLSLTLNNDYTVLSKTLKGALDLQGITVNYLEGMPPVTNVGGTATFTEKAFDIYLTSGMLQEQRLIKGHVWITGLDLADQHLKTELFLKGPLPNLLKILSYPPLMYTQKIDVPLETLKGSIDIALTLAFPLENNLTFEQVALQARGQIQQFAYDFPLPAPAKLLRFEKGVLGIAITPQRMELKGKAILHKEPVNILWKEVFNDPSSRQLLFEAQITPLSLQTWKINLGDSLKGTFPLKFYYTPHGKIPLRFEGDLTPSALKISLLNWEKKSGIPAQLTGIIKKHPHGTQIENLTLKSSDISFQGNIFLSPTYALDRFSFPEIKSPRNNCSLHYEHTKNGIALTLSGKAADIGAFLDPSPEGSSDNLLDDKTKFYALFDVEKIYVGTENPLYDFKGSLNGIQKGQNFEILRADLRGKSSPLIPTPSAKPRTGDFALSIQKPTPDSQAFSLRSANGGYLLKALGLVLNVRGGELTVMGNRKNLKNPFQGKIILENFIIAKTPFLTQFLMTLASPTSFLGLFSNGKIDFSQFNCDFTWKDPIFSIKEGLFQSSNSGISLDGKINLQTKVLDLRGNLIPAYIINKPLSAIPILGDILGGGKGDGIGATRFFVKGPVDQPNISVNPMQIIAPGIIKKLFSAFSSDSDDKAES